MCICLISVLQCLPLPTWKGAVTSSYDRRYLVTVNFSCSTPEASNTSFTQQLTCTEKGVWKPTPMKCLSQLS